jgi:hypothetical protein
MRTGWLAVLIGTTLALAGCTVTVGGSASPAPGQGAVKKDVDPCTLLSPDQVDALGYKSPGKPEAARPEQLSPAMCLWSAKDDSAATVILNIGWAVDISLDEYLQGAVVKAPATDYGGLKWTQYGSLIPDDCVLYTTLGEKSFVFVSVSAGDATKSCDAAKTVAPVVASHLPGGSPAPSITPSSSAPPVPSGPLAGADPCTTLKPDQAGRLKVDPQGVRSDFKEEPNVSFCLWKDTDGDSGQKPFEVWFGPSTAATAWPALVNVPPTETQDVSGKKWAIYPNVGGGRVECDAVLPVTDTSSVRIVSGYIGDESKMCDAVKAGLPLVTANLPS